MFVRSTKLIEMGRRKKVVGESSTRTSTNCPGNMSGKGFSSVSFMSTCLGLSASTEETLRSRINFFIMYVIACFFMLFGPDSPLSRAKLRILN